ncbi:MAG: DUF1844 domain-containing protein [Phycisphaerae bacterium]|jgi:hypothetical protein|nr:DUF1844 domain-containing protein [Phycisphaerae bacterium]
MTDSDSPKIFIDDDWKRQAQEEKERLAQQEQAAKKETKATDRPTTKPAEGTEEHELPQASFEALVSTLTSQALLALGVVEHPSMGKMLNLDLAKFNIDLLGIIEEKTKGNLNEQEKQMMEQTLHQLRMMFVEISSRYTGPLGKK